MLKLACPSCGAEIIFKSAISVFAVCSYCDSMVVRRDVDLQAIGKMAQLPADTTPLQIGSTGYYDDKRFELVGRVKLEWQDGLWSEWFAVFDDARNGWLANAQGLWMMSFLVDAGKRALPKKSALRVGGTFALLPGQKFEVMDIKEVVCVAAEGELPIESTQGRKSTSVDLCGPDNQFACIDYAQDGTRLYIGRYVEFEQMRFTSLRQMDGW